jgi:hypothetical protein
MFPCALYFSAFRWKSDRRPTPVPPSTTLRRCRRKHSSSPHGRRQRRVPLCTRLAASGPRAQWRRPPDPERLASRPDTASSRVARNTDSWRRRLRASAVAARVAGGTVQPPVLGTKPLDRLKASTSGGFALCGSPRRPGVALAWPVPSSFGFRLRRPGSPIYGCLCFGGLCSQVREKFLFGVTTVSCS